MYWRDIGYLCTEHEQLDSLGKPYKAFDKRKVYCNSKGVKRNEFYQAQAQGYRPELCVDVRESEYHHENHFEFGGVMYRIIRTYPVAREALELVCQALIQDDGGANVPNERFY